MSEPGPDATDAELAEYYDEHRDQTSWAQPRPVSSDRLEVTISVRFTAAEIAAIRARAEAAGVKPTAYIRRLALTGEQPPLDRGQLSHLIEVLTRDLEDLRQATG
jgi:hypothetical protein